MHRARTPWLLALAAVLVASPAESQERPVSETLSPDRPGIGTGAHVLGRGALQLEAGVAYARLGASDVYSFGQTLLRYGVGPLEARLGLDSFVVARGARRFEGFEDVAVGAKAPFLGWPADPFRVSGLVTLSVPTGAVELTADDPVATVAALAEWSVSDRLTLSANAGWGTPLYTGGDRWLATLTPGLSLPLPGDPSVYVGWAGYAGEQVEEDAGHAVEAGFTALLGPEIQLDVNAGWTPGTGDYFIGTGIAHRWR